MGRVLAIDYGKKRVGFAHSDELRITANPLGTVAVHEVWKYIDNLVKNYAYEVIVVGYATQNDGADSESMQYIHPFFKGLVRRFPLIKVEFEDERYTSVMAAQSLIESGASKQTRQDKGLIDTISATLILQSFLNKPIQEQATE